MIPKFSVKPRYVVQIQTAKVSQARQSSQKNAVQECHYTSLKAVLAQLSEMKNMRRHRQQVI